MKTTAEVEAEIVRLHYAEHWRVGTIATQLALHPDVVKRVLGLGVAKPPSQMKARMVDPYREFIDDTLRRYPKLLATRLYDMVRERGFAGGVRTLREHVALVRPRRRREVYLTTETLAGEQAQVDWAFVGKLPFPRRGAPALAVRDGAGALARDVGRMRPRPVGSLVVSLAGARVGRARRCAPAVAVR